MIYLDHLLNATHGVLLHPGKQSHFDAFSHDSRQLIPGELFVAVRGERGNGHDYLLDAVQRGATGLLVEGRYITSMPEQLQATLAESRVATIVVEDTRIALQEYAHYILGRWHPTVIAVTGSTGKTSTKEAIAAVLSSNFATFASWQNYNDLLGLPLSLGRLEERHEYAVLELSCDLPGEIKELCQIARPSIGVLTNISPTQLQYFGTVELLAAELCTLLTSLPQTGTAIVNANDMLICNMISNLGDQLVAPIKIFSPSKVQGVEVTWNGTRGRLPFEDDRAFSPPEGMINRAPTLVSHLLGAHHISTMLAAYAVGRQCGLNPQEIEYALANLLPMPGRMNPLQGVEGATLLDDTHNAAPASVIAGLEALRVLHSSCRIAVLGDMLRLGSYEEEAHQVIGEKAAQCVDYLIARGERAVIIADSARKAGLKAEQIIITSTHEDAAKAVRNLIAGAQFGAPSPGGNGEFESSQPGEG